MSSSPPGFESPSEVASPPDFLCEYEDKSEEGAAAPACAGLRRFGEHNGKSYCVLHYPAADKSEPFRRELERKLERRDFNFRGVWFPDDLELRWHTFDGKVDFSWAVFNGETVLSRNLFAGGVDFSYAVFAKDVYFSLSEFVQEAVFDNTVFRALAYFRRAVFHSLAKFESATFGGEADFTVTSFHGAANFGYTTCASYVKFSSDEDSLGFGPRASLDFQYANVERPERISFNLLTLEPRWFINSDPRKFDFATVTWPDQSVGEVLRLLEGEQVASPPGARAAPPHRRLALAYRHLAVNAEENHRYGEASDFRYWAMDTRRREKGRGFAFWTLDWWYWLASGYGESVAKAFVILLLLWGAFAVSYMYVGFARWEPRPASEAEARDAAKAAGDDVGKPLRPGRAFVYSLGTLTLQRPEPRPATAWAYTFVILETLLGPLQVGLLALATRRKFMR